jgi:hypothetical protein
MSTFRNIEIFQYDAREMNKKLAPHSVDAIITEPYLGKPLRGNETRVFLETQVRELEQLYLQTFASFQKILRPGGTIIFVTPAFRHQKEWLRIRLPIPAAPIKFARPDQRVGRDIWKYQISRSRLMRTDLYTLQKKLRHRAKQYFQAACGKLFRS